MDKKEYEIISKNKNILWSCPECISKTSNRLSTDDNKLDLIFDEINKLKIEVLQIKDLKKENKELKDSITFLSAKYDVCLSKLEDITNDNKLNKKENISLKTTSTEQESTINKILQQEMLNDLEIHGIPETKDEDLHEIFKKTCLGLNMTNVDSDKTISNIYRSGRIKENKLRPIVIKTNNPDLKKEMLKKIKEKKGMTLKCIDIEQVGFVYINEHLTDLNKKLLFLARKLRREKHVAFAWTKDCKIFVRKTDSSKIINIKKEEY
jgi:hypothetical protein